MKIIINNDDKIEFGKKSKVEKPKKKTLTKWQHLK